jgi:hypothetical protein
MSVKNGPARSAFVIIWRTKVPYYRKYVKAYRDSNEVASSLQRD